jgi:hypothetical protein
MRMTERTMENRKQITAPLEANLEWELLTHDAVNLLVSQDESIALLQRVADGAVAADIDDDAPLTLEQAVCLPELGGSYTVNDELRSPSEAVKVKTLRGAIDRGEIVPGWKDRKNMFVTRRMLREWLERCLAEGKKRTSSSGARAGTNRAGSPTAPRGSSRRRQASC